MILFSKPEPLFNPVVAPLAELPTAWEIIAGPFGLLLFIPLIPILRLLARRWPRASLLVVSTLWIAGTAGPWTVIVIGLGCAIACVWITLLAWLRKNGSLSERSMTALVWIGLSLLVLPLWWLPRWEWYGWVVDGSRFAALHNVGFAYFYLRLISWGVDWSRNPNLALRPIETACWLAYPACQRLGPVVRRETFLERFDAWRPPADLDWKRIAQRIGWFLLGGIALGVVGNNMPEIAEAGADFLAAPELFGTDRLIGAFYLVPIQIYLLLWTYNELAAICGLLVGIRVDNNFNWLPLATSVKDFWHRWHITVGAWLRDYVYIPLGGNRGHAWVHITIVFLFCGVWHGAAWSFIAWGLSQALALTVQRWWEGTRRKPDAGAKNQRPTTNNRAPTTSKRLHGLRPKTALCWLFTMHYQLATILIFVDFEHLGRRFFAELARRAAAALSF